MYLAIHLHQLPEDEKHNIDLMLLMMLRRIKIRTLPDERDIPRVAQELTSRCKLISASKVSSPCFTSPYHSLCAQHYTSQHFPTALNLLHEICKRRILL